MKFPWTHFRQAFPRHFLYPALMGSLAALHFGCASHSTESSAAAAPKTATERSEVKPSGNPGAPITLFDGKTLAGWAVSDFGGRGEVKVRDGQIILEQGVMTGVTWTNDLPRMNYEISLEAMRVDGSDFFCGLTFPVGKDPCSLIVGGWGGGVVGISSLDGEDAANNETTKYMNFERGRWYKIRLRVLPAKIQAWIDEEQVVDVETTGRRISIRIEVEPSVPLGIAAWSTTSALRNIRIQPL